MAGIDIVAARFGELPEEREGIGRSKVQPGTDDVDGVSLGEDPKVGVADRRGKPIERFAAVLVRLAAAERHEPGFDVLGKRVVGDGVPDEGPGQRAFPHAAPRPVDHLGREHRADAHFLAEPEEEHVHAG